MLNRAVWIVGIVCWELGATFFLVNIVFPRKNIKRKEGKNVLCFF